MTACFRLASVAPFLSCALISPGCGNRSADTSSAPPAPVASADATGGNAQGTPHAPEKVGIPSAPPSPKKVDTKGPSPMVQIDPREPQLAKEIEKLRGKVERDAGLPGNPVVAVTLYNDQFPPARVKELAAFKHLATLSLIGSHVTDEWLADLEELKRLTALVFFNAKLTPAGIGRIAKLTDLTSLSLYGVSAGADSVGELVKLPNLTDLDLAETGIMDEGVKGLARLPNLTALSFSSNPVTDRGVKELIAFKKLRQLNLYGTRVTDAGMKDVAQLTTLTKLYLGATAVSDAGLNELSTLKNLELLSLFGCKKVTDVGVSKLQKALPKCSINKLAG